MKNLFLTIYLLLSIGCFAQNTPYTYASKMPDFKGGDNAAIQFVKENVVFTKCAADSYDSKLVIIRLTIQKDGSVSNAEVIDSIGCDMYNNFKEASMKMPKWTPGKLDNGEAVDAYKTISFRATHEKQPIKD